MRRLSHPGGLVAAGSSILEREPGMRAGVGAGGALAPHGPAGQRMHAGRPALGRPRRRATPQAAVPARVCSANTRPLRAPRRAPLVRVWRSLLPVVPVIRLCVCRVGDLPRRPQRRGERGRVRQGAACLLLAVDEHPHAVGSGGGEHPARRRRVG